MKRRAFVSAIIIILIGMGISPGNGLNDKELIPNSCLSSKKPVNVLQYTDPDPFDWPVSSPEEQGLDSNVLELALRTAEQKPYMYSLLVVRHGYLIAEGYFNGQSKHSANHLHSASKSYTSTLVGIALREGFLTSLDQKMMDYFPDYASPDLDPRKYNITIRHLLMMRAGFDWDDTEAQWREYSSSPDWVSYAINCPLQATPGQLFHYSTIQTNLLSVILTRASGMSTKEFADKYLLSPLKISIRHWHRDPQGHYTGGHEMYYSPRDMARFGYLFLKNGVIDGNQIVPAQWIADLWQVTGHSNWPWSPLEDASYGYQWWIGKLSGFDVFFASGKGGQHILCIPELDMIIVTSTNAVSWSDSWIKNIFTLKLAAHYILAPVRGKIGPAPYPPVGTHLQKVENRGLVLRENIHILRWEPNPLNSGTNISGYRIYIRINGDLSLTTTVDSSTFEFWFRESDPYQFYTHAISALTDDGRESGAQFFYDH